MKTKLLFLFTSVSLILLSFCIAPGQLNPIKKRASIDTDYYYVYIEIERGVIEENIKTYKFNGKLFANIKTKNYAEYTYVNTPPIRIMGDSIELKQIALTNVQIDTLNAFSRMLAIKNLRYNFYSGAGRMGLYKTIIKGDTTKLENKVLYSLAAALGYERK